MKFKNLLSIVMLMSLAGVSNCVVQTAGPSCTSTDSVLTTHTRCIDYSSAGYDASTLTMKENACTTATFIGWGAGTWSNTSACDSTKYTHTCTVNISGGKLGANVKTYYADSGTSSGATNTSDQLACSTSLGSYQ